MKNFIPENERRASSDRRRFCYAAYAPERRSGSERRSIIENWSGAENGSEIGRGFDLVELDAKTDKTTRKVL